MDDAIFIELVERKSVSSNLVHCRKLGMIFIKTHDISVDWSGGWGSVSQMNHGASNIRTEISHTLWNESSN